MVKEHGLTLQTDIRADGRTDGRPAGRTGYHNIPAFSSKSAGIIKRNIRKCKRAYRKSKSTGYEIDWQKFKKCQISLLILYAHVRKPSMTSLHLNSSQNHFPQKTGGLHSRRPFLRSLNLLSHHSNLMTLYIQMTMVKRKLSTLFFQSHTLLEEQNAFLPDLHLGNTEPQLSHFVLRPYEVERVLEIMPKGKANGISSRIL